MTNDNIVLISCIMFFLAGLFLGGIIVMGINSSKNSANLPQINYPTENVMSYSYLVLNDCETTKKYFEDHCKKHNAKYCTFLKVGDISITADEFCNFVEGKK